MQDGVEKLLWEQAWRVYGQSLGTELSEALGNYKRSAGFDEMQRFYPITVAAEALEALGELTASVS